MSMEGPSMNQPPQKKGIKETLSKLAKMAALGAALGGAPAETKAIDAQKFATIEESINIVDRTADTKEHENLEHIVFNPGFDLKTMKDPSLYEGPMQIGPAHPNVKPPSTKKTPESKAAPTGKKLPPSIGW